MKRFVDFLSIFVYVLAGISILMLALIGVVHLARADDAPPSTKVSICGGTLPVSSLKSNHDGPCYTYTVSATQLQSADYLGHRDDDEFRHIYFEGGDPACLFTARRHVNPEGSVWLTDISGGRDCNDDTPDTQCGYIAEGFAIYAVTGMSCSTAAVPICQGPFCI